MRDQDKRAFAELMASLCLVFDKDKSGELIALYWLDMGPYNIEHFRCAVDRARRELKFFPKPVELIEFTVAARDEEYRMRADALQLEDKEYRISPDEAKRTLREFYEKMGWDWEHRKVGDK